MASRKSLAQRLFGISKITNPNPTLTNCRIVSAGNQVSSDHGEDGMFRRYIHRQSSFSSTAAYPGVRFLPTGEKLMEMLRGMGVSRERFRFDGLIPPKLEERVEEKLTVMDAKKILRVSQLELVKSRLREIEKDSISYKEFLEICGKDCLSGDLGLEFAKLLDESGSVIVLGNVVFLRPEQVVKAIQRLIPISSPPNPEDPRMKQLQQMEKQKSAIDREAEFLVRRELWCGLGYLVIQTAAFMRLTFWELSWDVMEPICFYVTSMYFMGGYAFFLRTSKEPSFEGFFQSRFSVKQKRLMKKKKFDLEKYYELKKACYPNSMADREIVVSFSSSVHDIALRT